MGLNLFFSSHSSETPARTVPVSPPNPDPHNFVIRRVASDGDYLVVLVGYPGVTTFEGNKLLVLKMDIEDLHKLDALDPHFSEDGPVVARFRPDGWMDAMAFIYNKG